MSGNNNVRAPYNFVPFHTKGASGADGTAQGQRVERVLVRYDSLEALPRHDRIDPKLLTGEIQVTMTAETPVFVSDGNKENPHFFRGPNGEFMLPGSTIRGMVRQNMQILGFGLVRPGEDLEDYQIYFREMTAATGTAGEDLKKYYQGALGIRAAKGKDGKSRSVPEAVKAGYLRKGEEGYYIQPVKGGSYIRVPRNNRALVDAGLVEGEAKSIPVAYTAQDGMVKYLRQSDAPVPSLEQGCLLYTGKGIGRDSDPKKKNARYLFPAADESALPVPISELDRISYQEDFETRRNVLGKNASFWALPEGKQEKPVFYIRHNGHTYFGMSLFLRIGYSHPLSEGLPRPLLPRTGDAMPLDYTHAILGFAEKENAYRSRVSFGDFTAQGRPRELPAVHTILGQPKPSWYPGYVTDGKNYNEDNFYLRGWKLYWMKEQAVAPPTPDGKEKVGSTLRPLDKGTAFQGVIRFKNLHEDELGLLLWALRLEKDCWQSVGMGKPYGFGRMKLTIDSLRVYDITALYQADSLCHSPVESGAEAVERYIRAYDAYACEVLPYRGTKKDQKAKRSPSIRTIGTIADFFYMHQTIRSPKEASYLDLGDFKNLKGVLPTVHEIRKQPQETAPAAPEDPYEALRRKFSKL